MDKIAESAQLPISSTPGPHAPFLTALIIALRQALRGSAYRLNLTAPKDGSEAIRMVSLESVNFPVAANINNADPGYYAVVRCDVTGADRTLTGLVDGGGQEGIGGRVVTLLNVGTGGFDLIVSHEDVLSLAENRFKLPRQLDLSIAPEMAMQFWYDPTSLRWRVA